MAATHHAGCNGRGLSIAMPSESVDADRLHAFGGPALPSDLHVLAEQIRLVYQRIERLGAAPAMQSELTRAVRRAVQIGRHDPSAARAEVARLTASMDWISADEA